MADTNNTIKVDIIVNTKGSQESITTLKQDISNLKAAIEKSEKTGVNIKFNDTEKNIHQAIGELDKLQNKLDKLESGYGKNIDKSYGQYLKELKSDVNNLNEAERQVELSRTKAYESKLKQDKASENYWLNSQLRQAQGIETLKRKQEEADQSRFNRLKTTKWYDGSVKGDQLEFKGSQSDSLLGYYNRGIGNAKGSAMAIEAELKRAEMAIAPFQKQLRALNNEKQSLWRQLQSESTSPENIEKLRHEYSKVSADIATVTKEQEKYNASLGRTTKQAEVNRVVQDKLNKLVSDAKERTSVRDQNDFYDRTPKSAKDSAEAFLPPKLETYASQIRSMTAATEDFYQKWRKAGTEVSSIDFANAKMQLRAISLEQDSFHKAIEKSTNGMYSFGQSVEYFGAKLRSHLAWLLSGAVLGVAAGIPLNVVNSFKTLESAMAGVKQVLPSLEGDQSKANEQLQEFITIASRYSSAAEEVVDAGRSWGRMYKDVATVNLLVSQSAKMSIADNFSLAESVRGLESAMAQFGMKSQNINDIQMNSTHILDVWTKLSHNAGVSANDLTLAVERAGSAAHQTGVSFEFFNSLVAAGVRNTARSGAEIGGDNLAA